MEYQEKFKSGPEIQREKLSNLWSVICGLEFNDYEEFQFDGKNFLLIFFEQEEMNEDGEAWFSGSSAIMGGIDVYLLKTLVPEERKKKIFRVVLEAWAQSNGFFGTISHDFAVEQEKIFFSQ